LANVDRAYLVLYVAGGAGDAEDCVHVDLDQATDNGGTSAKAAAVVTRYWYKQGADPGDNSAGVLTAATQWTAVELTTAASDINFGADGDSLGTSADDGGKPVMIVLEILPENLDVDGGFTHVRNHQEADTFDTARIMCSHWVLTGSAYAKAIPNSAL